MRIRSLLYCCFACLILLPKIATADGQLIDKVYHPYVLANEREMEYRFLSHKNDAGNQLAQRVGFGFSLSETVAAEAYVIGERDLNGQFTVHSYEAETRWMLTEQGQYWVDVGVLFELGKNTRLNKWDVTSGLMVEKEFGKTSLTLNYFLVHQWGKYIESEFNSQFRLQYRYRWMPQLQPAIELYSNDGFVGIGPAFIGLQRFKHFKQLKWEASFILGLNGDALDNALRISIEYEF